MSLEDLVELFTAIMIIFIGLLIAATFYNPNIGSFLADIAPTIVEIMVYAFLIAVVLQIAMNILDS